MGFVSEFRDFALKGNVVDMAVGVIMGAAFGKIVNSMVQDIMMPPLGYMIAGVDFKNAKYVLKPADEAAKLPEVAITYGNFINLVIEFTIVAFCLFMVIKAMNRLLTAKGNLIPGIPSFGRKE